MRYNWSQKRKVTVDGKVYTLVGCDSGFKVLDATGSEIGTIKRSSKAQSPAVKIYIGCSGDKCSLPCKTLDDATVKVVGFNRSG